MKSCLCRRVNASGNACILPVTVDQPVSCRTEAFDCVMIVSQLECEGLCSSVAIDLVVVCCPLLFVLVSWVDLLVWWWFLATFFLCLFLLVP